MHAASTLQAVRRFSAFWEYMLDRALVLSPSISSWGGSAAVDERGRVIGIVSLRLGEPPHVNLAIPAEKLLAVKDELMKAGRVMSRRPRPVARALHDGRAGSGGRWTASTNPAPRVTAGFRRGDLIVGVNGVDVASQEEFYEQLWRRQAGDTIDVSVRRNGGVQVISVRSIDRYRLYRPLP